MVASMKERRRDFRLIEENRVVIEMPGVEGLEGGETVRSRSWQVVKIHGRVKWVKEIDQGLYWMGIEFIHEIPENIISLISHLFRKQTNIPAVIQH
jgi:hypothetical protein